MFTNGFYQIEENNSTLILQKLEFIFTFYIFLPNNSFVNRSESMKRVVIPNLSQMHYATSTAHKTTWSSEEKPHKTDVTPPYQEKGIYEKISISSRDSHT